MGEQQELMQTIEEWWDSCHTTEGSFYVSDYSGPELWKALNISERIIPGASVLEIGVGGGSNVKELSARGLKVYVLDITQAALQKVEPITEGRWLESQIDLIPKKTFDLAMSHLVTQHLNNRTLSKQIRYILRALKPGGIFAMQFADHINGTEEESFNEKIESQRVGAVCRSITMMKQIVNASGGKITWISPPQNFHEYGSRWFYIHIKRRRFSARFLRV